MVVQKLVDATLVEPARRQSAKRHPVREVRQRSEASTHGTGRVASLLQAPDIGSNERRQRAVEQPGALGGAQSRNLQHGSLHEW